MSVQCKDLLNFPSLKSIKLIGGQNGLDRIIRWVYYGDTLDNMNEIVDWLDGNELMVITEHLIADGFEAFLEALPKLNDAHVAGIIINAKNDMLFVPYEVVELTNKLNLPLFILPWSIKLANVTREICSAITLDELNEKTERDILYRSLWYATS